MAGKATPVQKKEWLEKYYVENKDKADSTPKIDISSMKCTFKVYGPGRNLSNVVYDFTAPCFNPDGWQDALHGTYSSIKDYINQNRNGWLGGSHLANQGRVKNVFDTLDNQGQYPVLFPLSSKLLITDFGARNNSLYKSMVVLRDGAQEISKPLESIRLLLKKSIIVLCQKMKKEK